MLAPERLEGIREVYTKLAVILDASESRLRQLSLSDIEIVDPNSEFVEDVRSFTTDRAKSFEDVRLGRQFFQQVITLPVRVAAPAVNHR